MEELDNLVVALGGARLVRKIGCKFMVDRDRKCVSLFNIKSKKCNIIRVTLEDDGTYTMKFYLGAKWKLEVLDELFDIKAEEFNAKITEYTGIEI